MRTFLWLLLCPLSIYCQFSNSNWHFGFYCGVTFSTGVPVSVPSAIFADEGSSSLSDIYGKLLFYTNGDTVWNSSHQVMPNGFGLLGHASSTQSSLIIRRPGSNSSYYLFTTDQACYSNGLKYSIVDMSLSAGNGSVTIKNAPVTTSVTERLAAARHCNGEDVWVIVHDCGTNVFRSYLITNAGVSATAVTSTIGPIMGAGIGGFNGELKVSPDGKFLGLVYSDSQGSTYHLFDFNPKSGTVSNWLTLGYPSQGFSYGCTFSPGSNRFFVTQHDSVVQWDLCAGSPQSIIASRLSYRVVQQPGISTHWPRAMQIGPDCKIYIALQGPNQITQGLGVIGNPDAAQGISNYTHLGVSLTTGTVNMGLPNFINDLTKNKTASVSHSVNCAHVSFNWQPLSSCAVTASVSSVSWSFGEPSSGVANSSSISAPFHDYFASGTYTVKLNINYDCGKDSIVTQVVIPSGVPSLSISAPFKTCAGDQIMMSVSGADTYSWSTGQQTNTIILKPATNTIVTVTGSNTATQCQSTKSFSVNVSQCLGLAETSFFLKIFPNPVSETLKIDVGTVANIRIFTVEGREVANQQLQPGENFFSFAGLSPGLYLLQVHLHDQVIFLKTFKE